MQNELPEPNSSPSCLLPPSFPGDKTLRKIH
jgi:hypothetical protein